jgi:hypothetical protein
MRTVKGHPPWSPTTRSQHTHLKICNAYCFYVFFPFVVPHTSLWLCGARTSRKQRQPMFHHLAVLTAVHLPFPPARHNGDDPSQCDGRQSYIQKKNNMHTSNIQESKPSGTTHTMGTIQGPHTTNTTSLVVTCVHVVFSNALQLRAPWSYLSVGSSTRRMRTHGYAL